MSETVPGKDFVPYEQTHRLRPLLLVTTIVPEGQSGYVIQLSNENEAAICCVCHGKGTISAEMALALSLPMKKEVVFSLIRADRWGAYKAQLAQRFSVSKMAKGIAYAIPVDSVAGISIYKMLTNTRLFEKPISAKGGKKK